MRRSKRVEWKSVKHKTIESLQIRFFLYKRGFVTITVIGYSDMDCYTLLLLTAAIATSLAWSVPFHAVHRPLRVTRYAPLPPHRPFPIRYEKWQRPKRGYGDHGYYGDHENAHDYDHEVKEKNDRGVTGPVHTFVKTDRNANYKWGVRHHVGNKYAA